MGEKGIEPLQKLPKGYYAPAPGTHVPGAGGITGLRNPDATTEPGQAFPTGRPGYPITWEDEHGTWRPPGFKSDPSESDHIFNQTTGQNGVWDDDKKQWIDAKTGQPISYEQ